MFTPKPAKRGVRNFLFVLFGEEFDALGAGLEVPEWAKKQKSVTKS